VATHEQIAAPAVIAVAERLGVPAEAQGHSPHDDRVDVLDDDT
jgi:hypothetical protein